MIKGFNWTGFKKPQKSKATMFHRIISAGGEDYVEFQLRTDEARQLFSYLTSIIEEAGYSWEDNGNKIKIIDAQ